MENDYKKELEKDEKNPYQEQIEAQKEQIEELKAQIANQQKQMKSAYQPNNAYQGQSGYQQSGYAEAGSGYQQQSGYQQSGQRYQGNDVYAKRATQKAYGDYDKQSQIKRRTNGVDAVMSFSVLGAMAFSGKTAAIGSAVASGASAAGLTSIAALGSLPVAGPLLLGGGAIIGAAVAGYMALDTIYQGAKGLSGLSNNNRQVIFNRPNFQIPAMQPIRTKNSAGKFKELKDKSNKVDEYLKDIKQDFANKKDIGAKIKDVANLKGLTSKQKKEVAGLYGDNIIRNSAKDNGGIVNAYNVKKQVVRDAKEQGWNKSKTAQMVRGVNKRLEVQKDKQNITKDGKVLSVQAQRKPQAQTQKEFNPVNVNQSDLDFSKSATAVKQAIQTVQNSPVKQNNNIKSIEKQKAIMQKNQRANEKVQKQTVNVGNSVKAAANNLNLKPQPQKQSQPQKTQSFKSSSKDNERGR